MGQGSCLLGWGSVRLTPKGCTLPCPPFVPLTSLCFPTDPRHALTCDPLAVHRMQAFILKDSRVMISSQKPPAIRRGGG